MKLRGTITILRALPGQHRAPYRSRAHTNRRRDANVRSIVRYAAHTVPHYRELFRELGVDPAEIETADNLARLPLVDKEQVQSAPERFRSDSELGADAVRYRTAGTTGLPLDVYHDLPSLLANIAYSERDRAVEVKLCGKRLRYTGLHLDYGQATFLKVQDFYGRQSYRPFRPARHFVTIEQPLETLVDRVNALAPDVLRGNGGHLEAFFRAVTQRGLRLRTPRVVVYYGDTMTPDGRALIEQRLGVPVISRYGAMEAFKIGYTCEARRGFHLYEDLTHVSIVDRSGQPVPAGELGEVVVSNLVNRGTVLLNYRLSDLARLLPPDCACGRTSPLLADLEGRLTEIVYLPDGEFVYPAPVWGLSKEVDGIVRFQLVQHERDRFELRLATVDEASFERAADHMGTRLRALLRDCRLEISSHEAIEPEPGRKFRPIKALPAPE
jgi:phenylacetate-coenzyme A ligase PaaK-like adenylate-forming protein